MRKNLLFLILIGFGQIAFAQSKELFRNKVQMDQVFEKMLYSKASDKSGCLGESELEKVQFLDLETYKKEIKDGFLFQKFTGFSPTEIIQAITCVIDSDIEKQTFTIYYVAEVEGTLLTVLLKAKQGRYQSFIVPLFSPDFPATAEILLKAIKLNH